MGGGRLILGVNNSGKIVGTPSVSNIGEVKKQLFENL
jgi:predicted HTH transcriptional regulator